MRKTWMGALAITALVPGGRGNKTDSPTRTSTSGGGTSTAPAGTTEAAKDRALVRFVNADSDNKVLDLWFGDTREFSTVEYKRVTAYTEVPAERKEFHLR